MSHARKILLRIIVVRVRQKIKSEIAEQQCGQASRPQDFSAKSTHV